ASLRVSTSTALIVQGARWFASLAPPSAIVCPPGKPAGTWHGGSEFARVFPSISRRLPRQPGTQPLGDAGQQAGRIAEVDPRQRDGGTVGEAVHHRHVG